MGGRRSYRQPILFCEAGNNAPQSRNVGSRFLDIATNPSADLNHGLNHLRLDLLSKQHLALFENFSHMRSQLTSVRIYDLEFFLNSQGKLIEHLSPHFSVRLNLKTIQAEAAM